MTHPMSETENMDERMKAFTPGPRTVDRDDSEDGSIYYAVYGAGYDFIANFDKRGDALLDAAAPDLLAALQRSEQYIVLAVHDNKGSLRMIAEKDLVLVRAAIAKATATP